MGNTLFDKFKGVAEGMQNFHSFLAVVGLLLPYPHRQA